MSTAFLTGYKICLLYTSQYLSIWFLLYFGTTTYTTRDLAYRKFKFVFACIYVCKIYNTGLSWRRREFLSVRRMRLCGRGSRVLWWRIQYSLQPYFRNLITRVWCCMHTSSRKERRLTGIFCILYNTWDVYTLQCVVTYLILGSKVKSNFISPTLCWLKITNVSVI